MNKQVEQSEVETAVEVVDHGSIYAALVAAQMAMGPALKTAKNDHFKRTYADLASVMEACVPALNANGIAVYQPTTEQDGQRFVETILAHVSGEKLSCLVPLIVSKNDMQGYGSAVTYARRYGLMSMAGIAPEDDDGNAAAKAPPQKVETVTPEQFVTLRDKAEEAGVNEADICKAFNTQSLQQFPANEFDRAIKRLDLTIKDKAAKASETLEGDEIPY